MDTFIEDYLNMQQEVSRRYGEEQFETLSEDAQGILVDLAFNLGLEGLFGGKENKGFPGFLEDFRAGRYGEAAKELKYKNPDEGNFEESLWWDQIGGDTTEERIATGEWSEEDRKRNRATATFDLLTSLINGANETIPQYEEGGQVPIKPQETIWENIPIIDYLQDKSNYMKGTSYDLSDYSDITHVLKKDYYRYDEYIYNIINEAGDPIQGHEITDAIRDKHKYDYFGKDYYHRPFDEDIETKINSGELNRENQERKRLDIDLEKRSNPDNLSKEEHFYQWFGELDRYRELQELKKTDFRAYRRGMKELKMEYRDVFEEFRIPGRGREENYGVTYEDIYHLYKDKYSNVDDIPSSYWDW